MFRLHFVPLNMTQMYVFKLLHFLTYLHHLIEKSLHTLHSRSRSSNFTLKGSHKHLIATERIRAKLCDHIIWIDDVASSLGHLASVFRQYQSDSFQSFERLFGRHDTDIFEELMSKSRIDQMSTGMLHPSDIEIDLSSIRFDFRRHDGSSITRIHISDPVPRRSSPTRHRIGLTTSGRPIRQNLIDPLANLR